MNGEHRQTNTTTCVATIEPLRGRAQNEQRTLSMTQAISPTPPASSTFPAHFGTEGMTATVRGLVATMLDVWNDLPVGRRASKDSKVNQLRADIRSGDLKPLHHIVRVAFAAIDAGVAVDRVTQWAKDFIASVEAYAMRRDRRQSAGVLSFPETHTRLVTRSIREDADADCATASVIPDDIASLERARSERLEAIAADERLVEGYTQRIAELRSGR